MRAGGNFLLGSRRYFDIDVEIEILARRRACLVEMRVYSE